MPVSQCSCDRLSASFPIPQSKNTRHRQRPHWSRPVIPPADHKYNLVVTERQRDRCNCAPHYHRQTCFAIYCMRRRRVEPFDGERARVRCNKIMRVHISTPLCGGHMGTESDKVAIAAVSSIRSTDDRKAREIVRPFFMPCILITLQPVTSPFAFRMQSCWLNRN